MDLHYAAEKIGNAVIALATKADYKEAMRDALHMFAIMSSCELTGDAARIRDEINAKIDESTQQTGKINDIIGSLNEEEYERLAVKIVDLNAHIDYLRED